jgi:hypothetical protein
MDRRAGEGMVLTARDVEIVRSVAACGALTGEQVRRHHRFGSVGRGNATLLRLVRHGYLARRYQPTVAGTRRPIYVIDRRGIQLLGESRRALKGASDLFLHHLLLVNDVKFAFQDLACGGYAFQRWLTEPQLRDMKFSPRPDGFVEYSLDAATYSAFIEVDRATEGLKRFDEKVRSYLELAFSGKYERLFKRRFFRTLVVAPDAARVESLRASIGARTDKIFWLAAAPELLEKGPMLTDWARPRSTRRHSLTEP